MTGSIPPPNPLAYTGQVVVPFIQQEKMPLSTYNQFPVPTIWIDTLAKNAYILVAKPLGVADWILIGGSSGDIVSITTPSSPPLVLPIAGNINFLDGTGIVITSSTNNITFSTSGDVAVSYETNSGTATPALGILEINGLTGILTSASGDVINISLDVPVSVANGGTGATSFNPYCVLTGGTTSTAPIQSLASTGTTYQVLTSQGAGVVPVMADTQFSLLAHTIIHNLADVQFINLPNSDGIYFFAVTNIRPVTNNVTFSLNLSDDGGVTWISSGFQSSLVYNAYNSVTNVVLASTSGIVLGDALFGGGSTSYTGSYFFYFSEITNAFSSVAGVSCFTGQSQIMQHGRLASIVPISSPSTSFNSFQFIMSSGNIEVGEISVYKVLRGFPF